VALGALVQGIPVAGRAYAGGWWDWLTPFSILTGVALVIGYALLGATWLILKTEADVQRRAYGIALWVAPATVLLIGVVSLWTPFLNPIYMQRWLAWPQVLLVVPVPLAVLGAGYLLLRGLAGRREVSPFLAALALFVLSFIGLGISFYPYMVPHAVTIWQAAAPDNSLSFLLAGGVVLIPIILAYTAYAYWVFRGKVNAAGGYH
jgi:cytochrome d ubiquinol oxidase subunit II